MKIKTLQIGSIKPYKNNPRKNEEAVAYVMDSLREFGWQQPLVLDKDNVLIVGHTRLLAAKQLGYKDAPCIVADNLTPAQVKAYRIMDNRSGEIATWDKGLLFPELDDILAMDGSYDMEFFRFADYELPSAADRIEDDEPEEKPKKTAPKVGDTEPMATTSLKTMFEVVVECESEEDQQAIYNRLSEEGLKCRVLSM